MSEMYSDINELGVSLRRKWRDIIKELHKETEGVEFPHRIIWIDVYAVPTPKPTITDVVIEYYHTDYTQSYEHQGKTKYLTRTVFLHFLGFDNMKEIVESLKKYADEDFKSLELVSEPPNCPVYPNMGWWNNFYTKVVK